MTCSRGNLSGGLAFIVCGLIASASPAISADLAEPPHEQLAEPVSPPSDWQFNFTPYGWLTSVNGDVTVRGRTLDVDASFIDIVQESDSLAALMGHFEARKGRLSLYGDFVWDKLTFSADTLTLRNPIANLSLTTSASAGVDYRQSILEGGVAYEIARLPGYGGSAKDPYDGAPSFTAVDLLAGARYWRQEVDLSLAITGVVDLPSIGFTRSGNLAVARSGSMAWVDPVIGMRVRHQFSPGQEMLLRGDIGGFGVGSDFSWQLFGGYAFQLPISDCRAQGVVGYRALSVDFSENGPSGARGIDILQYGPVIGINFSW